MTDEDTEQALQAFGETSGVALLVEQYIWWFIAALVLLSIRETVVNLLSGISVYLGSDYDESQVVWAQINGHRRPARITQAGWFSSTLYLYDIEIDDEGKKTIVGGTLLKVSNTKLKDLLLERPLDKLPLDDLGGML
tara:strand:+ start:462 stop:872 length:411 start_codon:yes stop_codon:yes gene_type:complete